MFTSLDTACAVLIGQQRETLRTSEQFNRLLAPTRDDARSAPSKRPVRDAAWRVLDACTVLRVAFPANRPPG